MRSYRRIWFYIVGGLFLYLVGGILTFDLAKKKSNEVFPLFSWFLFADVPQKNHVRYTLRILRADDRDLVPALFFSEATAFANPKSVSANKLIDEIGRSIVRQEEGEVQRLRQTLEENQIHRIQRYELLKLTYDPVERYQTGKMQVVSIRIFEKGKE